MLKWVYASLYPSGPCPPFLGDNSQVSGEGWYEEDKDYRPGGKFCHRNGKAGPNADRARVCARDHLGTGRERNCQIYPNLGLALEKPDVVDRSRVMECDGKDVGIFQYVPDHLLEEDGPKYIDLRNNRLVLVRESSGARDEERGAAEAQEAGSTCKG